MIEPASIFEEETTVWSGMLYRPGTKDITVNETLFNLFKENTSPITKVSSMCGQIVVIGILINKNFSFILNKKCTSEEKEWELLWDIDLNGDLNRALNRGLNAHLNGDLNRDWHWDLNKYLKTDLNRDMNGDLNRDLNRGLNRDLNRGLNGCWNRD